MDYNKCRKAIGWTALRKYINRGFWIEPLTS